MSLACRVVFGGHVTLGDNMFPCGLNSSRQGGRVWEDINGEKEDFHQLSHFVKYASLSDSQVPC